MPAALTIAHHARDEAGGILVFWALALATIMGLAALTFDLGRVASTQTELQSFADGVALAAAGELDGNADAIDRATAAAAALVASDQTFGEGARRLQGAERYQLFFYDRLPPNDTAPFTLAPTLDGRRARYVRVVAEPVDVRVPFGAALAALTGGTRGPAEVGATAVAGFVRYACDVTPLMFCLPNANFRANEQIGTQILLRSGGNSAWGPGDFGFLDPSTIQINESGPCAGLSGVNRDLCLIGAEGSVAGCFRQDGVDTEPGQKVGIEDAVLNIRFDIYRGTMNSRRTNPLYRPGPSVIKGIVPRGGGSCVGNNADPSPDTMVLPRDGCFASGTCPYPRFGNGVWDRAAYVAMNHGGAEPAGAGTTRYQMYLAEIAAAAGGPILTGRAETGRPQCAPSYSTNPERRIVIGAAIDCTANPVAGRTRNVPVQEFFRLFLTEPVGSNTSSPPTLNLWVEVVGSAGGVGGGGGSQGRFHEVVQLFR
ncbi:MAG: pilus assembly protein TadG-related protein [Gemmobacter sp.]